MARKVLMIVYYYPPLGGIGGMRTLRLASRLPSLGWEPIVLTVSEGTLAVIERDASDGEIPGVRVFRTFNPDLAFRVKRLAGFDVSQKVSRASRGAAAPASLKARLATGLSDWAGMPDRFIDWFPFARRRAIELVRTFAPEVVFTSSPPSTCHIIAASVKSRTGVPWVADLRDPWIGRFYSEGHGLPNMVNSWLEKRSLTRADALSAVSESIGEDLRHRLSLKVEHIPNSYDEDMLASAAPVEEEGMNILYAGSLLPGRRDPGPVFRALSALRQAGREISGVKIVFAGNDVAIASELAAAEGVEDRVEVLGLLSPEEAAAREKGASALLYIQNFNSEAASANRVLSEGPTGKLLEYLGTGRPVLALMPSAGSSESLIMDTSAGEVAKTDDDVRRVLERWLDEFESTGRLASRARPEAIESYSSQAMASRFADLFDRVSLSATGRGVC